MPRQKNLVIIYQEDDWKETIPLKSSPETRVSFEEFYEFAQGKGWSVFRASIQWFDIETFSFPRSWTYSDKKWEKIETPIAPDAIFDKVSGKYDYSLFDLKISISKKIAVVNSPLFRTAFDNKFSQYLCFSEFMPATLLAENRAQFLESLHNISTEKTVVKEVYGSGGKQVIIKEKKILKKMADAFNYPVILQEFIETSGVPGMIKNGAVADLRLVYVEEDLVYALSRVAKEGSLHTNFHQGAHAVFVPLEKIPASCLKAAKKIQQKLSFFKSKNYSLDFMFTKDGHPIFIEMNTTPGFDLLRIVGTVKIKEDYYQKLLNSFLH